MSSEAEEVWGLKLESSESKRPPAFSGHGGYREGAGRPAKHGERLRGYQILLPPRVVAILDDMTSDESSRSAVVLELLAKAHKPIRDALKQRGPG